MQFLVFNTIYLSLVNRFTGVVEKWAILWIISRKIQDIKNIYEHARNKFKEQKFVGFCRNKVTLGYLI